MSQSVPKELIDLLCCCGIFPSMQSKTQNPVLRGLIYLLGCSEKVTDGAWFCLMRERKRGRKKNPLGIPIHYSFIIFSTQRNKQGNLGTAFGLFLIRMVRCCLKSTHPWFHLGFLAMLHMPASKTTTATIKLAAEFGHALLPLTKSSRVKPGLCRPENAKPLDVAVEAEGERDLRSLSQSLITPELQRPNLGQGRTDYCYIWQCKLC